MCLSCMFMKLEMHVHTDYSRDCLVSVEELRKECLKKGIIPCITDHNTIEGALEYRRRYGKRSCIVGEEIKTDRGEIIAFYVRKGLARGIGFQEAIRKLRRQGAIIAVPHPFDLMRRRSRLKESRESLRSLFRKGVFDMIEIYNSRTVLPFFDDEAKALFGSLKKIRGKQARQVHAFVGSDAHTQREVGKSYVEVPDFDVTRKGEFMGTFKRGEAKLHTRKSTILVHAVTKAVKILGLNRRFR